MAPSQTTIPQLSLLRGSFVHEVAHISQQLPEFRAKLQEHLGLFQEQEGYDYPLPLAAGTYVGDEKLIAINPAALSTVIGSFQRLTQQTAAAVREDLLRHGPSWQHLSAKERSATLLRLAAHLRTNSLEFIAATIIETGLTAQDASREIAHAIEYFEYYSREAVKLGTASLGTVQTQPRATTLRHVPIGAGYIFPSPRSPLKSLAYGAALALASGNSIVICPPENGSLVAQRFTEYINKLAKGACYVLPLASAGDLQHLFPLDFAICLRADIAAAIARNSIAPTASTHWILPRHCPLFIGNDADIGQATDHLYKALLSYNGQGFVRFQHVFGSRSKLETLQNALLQKLKGIAIGNPTETAVALGPLGTEHYFRDYTVAVGDGASTAPKDGYFATPAIVNASRSFDFRTETIGPWLAFHDVESEHDFATIYNAEWRDGVLGLITQDARLVEFVEQSVQSRHLLLNTTDIALDFELVPQDPFAFANSSFVSPFSEALLHFRKLTSFHRAPAA